MPIETFAQPEVAVAAVVAGAAASPSIRSVVRRGFVYGLAGALIAYDRTTATARGLARGVRSGVSSITPEAAAATVETPPPTPPPAT